MPANSWAILSVISTFSGVRSRPIWLRGGLDRDRLLLVERERDEHLALGARRAGLVDQRLAPSMSTVVLRAARPRPAWNASFS